MLVCVYVWFLIQTVVALQGNRLTMRVSVRSRSANSYLSVRDRSRAHGIDKDLFMRKVQVCRQILFGKQTATIPRNAGFFKKCRPNCNAQNLRISRKL